jgi:hypothetical protein
METTRKAVSHHRVAPRLRVVMLANSSEQLAKRSATAPATLFVDATCTRFVRDGVYVHTSLRIGRILLLLAAKRERTTTEDVINCVWGSRVDGGPDSADNMAHMLMTRANTIAAALQLTIISDKGQGWRARDLAKSAPTTASL